MTPKASMLVLGIEGSANKIGVGIVSDEGVILSNPRHTYGHFLYDLRLRSISLLRSDVESLSHRS